MRLHQNGTPHEPVATGLLDFPPIERPDGLARGVQAFECGQQSAMPVRSA